MTKTAQKDSLTGEEQGMGCGGQFYSPTVLRYEDVQYLIINFRTRKGG